MLGFKGYRLKGVLGLKSDFKGPFCGIKSLSRKGFKVQGFRVKGLKVKGFLGLKDIGLKGILGLQGF